MGISLSNRRRENPHHRLHHNHPPPPLYYYSDHLPQPPPQPPHNNYTHTHNNNNNNNRLTSTPHLSLPPPSPPPPPPQSHPPQISYGGGYGHGYYQNQYNSQQQQQQHPYFSSGYGQWNTMLRPVIFGPPPVQQQPPPPYFEHQSAKKVRNDVNVHKDTVRLVADDLRPAHHLVSFVFDALFDGSFSIIFFAKEEPNCTMVPHLPEAYPATKVPFKKGTAQKFLQPSGTGTDLGFFALDDLSKPSPEEVYPLVISAETVVSSSSVSDEPLVHKQVTQACLEKANDGSFKAKVMKQILWIEGVRYELRELYGIDNSTTQGNAASGLEDTGGKECVICLTEPKDTAVMPCRHLCLCSDCAKELRFQSNKCPICRQPINELLEIKVESNDEQH